MDPVKRRRFLSTTAFLTAVGSISSIGAAERGGASRGDVHVADGSSEEWPSFQYDSGNTGTTADVTGPSSDESEFDLSVRFRKPVVGDQSVYVRSYDGYIYAFDVPTGDQQWRTKVGWERGEILVDGETVYVLADEVSALDPETGERHWSYSEISPSNGEILGIREDTLVISTTTTLFAVDTRNGDERWRVEEGYVTRAMTDGNAVISEFEDETLRAFNVFDGSILWMVRTDVTNSLEIRVRGGMAFVGTDTGLVQAIDTNTGTEQWRTNVGANALGFAVNEDIVCVPGDDSVALDIESGTEVWTAEGVDPHQVNTLSDGFAVTGDEGVYVLEESDGSRLWETQGQFVESRESTVFVSTTEGSIRALTAASGDERWSYDLGTSWSYFAFTADVMFATAGLNLRCIDLETGTERWRATNPGQERWHALEGGDVFGTSPVVEDGTVYANASDRGLFAFDASSGTEQWRFEGNLSSNTPAIADGRIYVGGKEGTLYCVAADGTLEWEAAIGDDQISNPAVVEGSVYATDDSLIALDAESGDEEWRFERDEETFTAPAVVDGAVFVHSSTGIVYAVDARSGDLLWEYDVGKSLPSPSQPTATNETVYVYGGDGKLHAIAFDSGTRRWRSDNIGSIRLQPAVSDDAVYVSPNHTGELLVLDAETGRTRRSITVTERRHGGDPVVVGDTVYLGKGFSLFALDTESERVRWETKVGAWTSRTPPAIADDAIYFSAGRLYAFDGQVSKPDGESNGGDGNEGSAGNGTNETPDGSDGDGLPGLGVITGLASVCAGAYLAVRNRTPFADE